MRRVSQIFSLVLLALWFPATQCCALEAAGIGPNLCCDDGCGTDESCANDGCANLGSVPYKSGGVILKVAAPAVRDCPNLPGLELDPSPSLFETAEILPSAVRERPSDWVVVWQFVRRAAPPSRAPALRCA